MSVNACLGQQKWKIMSKLEQMSHIHNIYIYIYGVLIFKTILKNKFLKIVFEICFLIFYRPKICFEI